MNDVKVINKYGLEGIAEFIGESVVTSLARNIQDVGKHKFSTFVKEHTSGNIWSDTGDVTLKEGYYFIDITMPMGYTELHSNEEEFNKHTIVPIVTQLTNEIHRLPSCDVCYELPISVDLISYTSVLDNIPIRTVISYNPQHMQSEVNVGVFMVNAKEKI